MNRPYVSARVKADFPDYEPRFVLAKEIPLISYSDKIRSILAEAYSGITFDYETADDHPQMQRWIEAICTTGVKRSDARKGSAANGCLRLLKMKLKDSELLRSKLLNSWGPLTAAYNIASMKYVFPIGGDDFDKFVGQPNLVYSETNTSLQSLSGESIPVSEGNIVWQDSDGVTCQHWNAVQCARTMISPGSTNILFTIDSLGSPTEVRECEQYLIDLLSQMGISHVESFGEGQ